VYEAKLSHDTETFGKMDPYFIIETSKGTKHRTPTLQDVGKAPKWNHTLEVPIEGFDETLTIAVYDEDVINDSLVGEDKLHAEKLIGPTPGSPQILPIYFKGKKGGEVTISATVTYQELRVSDEENFYMPRQESNLRLPMNNKLRSGATLMQSFAGVTQQSPSNTRNIGLLGLGTQ
jgi:Ca2+-dependent lipid-binding protein